LHEYPGFQSNLKIKLYSLTLASRLAYFELLQLAYFTGLPVD